MYEEMQTLWRSLHAMRSLFGFYLEGKTDRRKNHMGQTCSMVFFPIFSPIQEGNASQAVHCAPVQALE